MKKKKSKYRSGFEDRTAEQLEAHGMPFEYETLRLDYTKAHYYKPDFILANGIIIETKGRFTPGDRAKMLLIKAQWPGKDIRLVFQLDNPIRKGSPVRYSHWCERNGFKCAFGMIPKAWLEETKR